MFALQTVHDCLWLGIPIFLLLLLHLLDSKTILSLEREYDKKYIYYMEHYSKWKKIILYWDKKIFFIYVMKILKRKRAAFYPNIFYAFLEKRSEQKIYIWYWRCSWNDKIKLKEHSRGTKRISIEVYFCLQTILFGWKME